VERGADLGLDPQLFWTPSLAAGWTVTIAFAFIAFAAACWMAGRRTAADLLS